MIASVPKLVVSVRLMLAATAFLAWRELAGLVAVLLGTGVYLWLAPSHLMGGDHGEFVALMHAPGIAHPPGYPLYVLYLRLMSWLPGELARPSSLATALLGGLQLALLYIAIRAWRMSSLAAAIAVSFYASSALALHLNSHAEVFALNGALAAAVLLLAGEGCPLKLRTKVFLSGLCLGLALSHHHSLVLLLPLVCVPVIAMCLSERTVHSFSPRKAGILFFGAVVLGLLPNGLLIPWSHQPSLLFSSWGPLDGLGDLLRHFLRTDFGTFQLASGSGFVDVVGQVIFLFKSLLWTWNILFSFAIVGFLYALVGASQPVHTRWRWATLLVCVISSGPLFVALFNMPLELAPRPAVVERFHLLPALLLAVPISFGLDIVSRWLRTYLLAFESGKQSRQSFLLDQLLGLLLVVASFSFNARISEASFRDRHSDHVHRALLGGLRAVRPGSLVIVKGDHRVFGYSALQAAAKYRPDLVFLASMHWQRLPYRRRFLQNPKGGLADIAALVDLQQKSGREVYFDQSVYRGSKIFGALPPRSVQQGLFRRVLRPGEPSPRPDVVLRENESLFESSGHVSSRILRPDGWSALVRFESAEIWRNLAREFEMSGRADLAAIARQRSVEYGPCFVGPCPVPSPSSSVGRSN